MFNLNLTACLTSSTFLIFRRNVCIFQRMFPPTLYREGRRTGPLRPPLKKREWVYMLMEDTNIKKAGNMEVILATDIDGLGFAGNIVTIPKPLARNQMLPVGVAVYCSPDNLLKYEPIRKANENRKQQTQSAHKMIKELGGMVLPVPMSPTVPWVLSKMHVKTAFRLYGIMLDAHCLEMEDGITTPGEYQVTVMINNLNSVKVKIMVYHHSKTTLPSLPKIFSTSPQHKFDLVEVIADAAQKLRTKIANNDV